MIGIFVSTSISPNLPCHCYPPLRSEVGQYHLLLLPSIEHASFTYFLTEKKKKIGRDILKRCKTVIAVPIVFRLCFTLFCIIISSQCNHLQLSNS